jgi:ABC-type transport system involved in multi-copper enzyme maturation permease subunit
MRWLQSFGDLFDWVNPKVSIWLTPIWILGVGALVALILLISFWGLLSLFSRRSAREAYLAIREGVLWPILWTVITFAAFGVLGTPLALNQGGVFRSLCRLPFVGTTVYRFEIPANAEDEQLAVRFRRSELKEIVLESEVSLSVAGQPVAEADPGATFEITGGTPYRWSGARLGGTPFPDEDVSRVYVRNPSGSPTELRLTVKTQVPYPEAATIVWTATSVLAVFALYFFQQLVFPKLSAVAASTAKSEIAQPLFLISLLLGSFLLGLFVWIPYNTFGEDIKVLKDCGMTTIMVLAIITALWAASTSVAEEIEGRTALTVLSKPIGRRQFIIGKYFGICWAVGVMFIILGAIFLLAVAYKPIYDARESARETPIWQECHIAVVQTVPGLVLVFMETIVLAAVSVAISTRLPMLANFVICIAVYALGHLTPAIVSSSANEFEPVAFFGQLVATVVPNLDTFNLQAAIAAGSDVPYHYLVISLVYCIVYGTVAMLLALVMFEDRDLA